MNPALVRLQFGGSDDFSVGVHPRRGRRDLLEYRFLRPVKFSSVLIGSFLGPSCFHFFSLMSTGRTGSFQNTSKIQVGSINRKHSNMNKF